MADFWSNSDRGYRIKLSLTPSKPNIPANSTNVRVQLALFNTTTTFAQYNCTASATVNGQTYSWSGSPNMLSMNSSINLIDKTVTIGHNSDGQKSFSFSATFSGSGGYSPGRLNVATGTMPLARIPRTSTVTAGTVNFGSALTITIQRADSSFKHTVRYEFAGKTGTIASNVDTSTSWTVPLSFANDVPNANSRSGTIYVDTYSGSSKIGTSQASFTGTVPADIKPLLSGVSLSDGNSAVQALIPETNIFVQILSNIKVSFVGAMGSYSSTISGFKAEIVGKNQVTTENGGTLGFMDYNGTITIRASVSDSRGRWSNPVDTTVTVMEYFAPILSFSVARGGSLQDVINVKRNARIAPLTVNGSQRNTMTLSFYVSRADADSYGSELGKTTWTSLAEIKESGLSLSGTYASNTSWKVKGVLKDKFTQNLVASIEIVGTEQVTMSYDRSGVGINKIRERGALDVKGDIYANDKPIQQYQLTDNNGNNKALPSTTDYNSLTTTGFYVVNNSSTNAPVAGKQFYVQVISENVNYVQQTAVMKGSNNRMFVRTKDGVNTWQPWVEYAQLDHPNLVNTGWVTIGNGFKYKRIGDVVYLDYGFRTNGVSSFGVGSIPAELVPKNMMFDITAWTRNPIRMIHVQINADGSISWLNEAGKYNEEYQGQLSWAI